MKLTIRGWNYEGAHFRGIESNTDERPLRITLNGDEADIVNYILDEFSYGPDEDTQLSLDELIEGFENGVIMNGDGCGCVLEIIDECGAVIYKETIDECGTVIYKDPQANDELELGQIDVTGVSEVPCLNGLVDAAVQQEPK